MKKINVVVMVCAALSTIGAFAQQNINQVANTKALSGTVNAGKGFLCRCGAIPGLHRAKAGIAVATVLGRCFAKIMQQRLATAGGDFAQA